MSSESVAIVGGTGYIGEAVHAHCLQTGVNAWVVGRRTPEELNRDPRTHRSSSDGLEHAIAGASTVYHLACVTTPATSEANPLLDIENVEFTMSLATACAKAGVRHLVFASSGGTVYGELTRPAKEDAPARPICSYGMGKLTCERYLEVFSRRSQLPVTILRMSNVYGDRQKEKGGQGVVSYLIRRIANGEQVVLCGNTVRDYIHIRDVVRAFEQARRRPRDFQVMNISTGVGTYLLDLTKLLYCRMAQSEQILITERRPFDVYYNVLDNTRAKALMEWVPEVSVAEGLQEALAQARCREL